MVSRPLNKPYFKRKYIKKIVGFVKPTSTLVVQQGITSNHLWDTLWSSSKLTILEIAQYSDSKREFSKLLSTEIPSLFQLIHSMHYGFGFIIFSPALPA